MPHRCICMHVDVHVCVRVHGLGLELGHSTASACSARCPVVSQLPLERALHCSSTQLAACVTCSHPALPAHLPACWALLVCCRRTRRSCSAPSPAAAPAGESCAALRARCAGSRPPRRTVTRRCSSWQRRRRRRWRDGTPVGASGATAPQPTLWAPPRGSGACQHLPFPYSVVPWPGLNCRQPRPLLTRSPCPASLQHRPRGCYDGAPLLPLGPLPLQSGGRRCSVRSGTSCSPAPSRAGRRRRTLQTCAAWRGRRAAHWGSPT